MNQLKKRKKMKDDKLTLIDLKNKVGGLMESIFYKYFPTDYKSIFDSLKPSSVDTYIILTYGEKVLIRAIDLNNHEDIIKSIIEMNLPVWLKQITIFKKEYDVLEPVKRVEERKETNQREEDKTNDIINSKKFFNDGEFTDGQKESEQTQQGWKEEKTYENTERGIGSGKLVSEVIQKEIKLRELNLRKNIINSLIKELTLDIY